MSRSSHSFGSTVRHRLQRVRSGLPVLLVLISAILIGSAGSAQSSNPPTTALMDLGTGTYEGFQGGWYPGGTNIMPALHAATGTTRAQRIEPRNSAGAPDPNGKYILISIGMSNTTQEFCGNGSDGVTCNAWTFMGQAARDSTVNSTTLKLINGARGGQAAASWDQPTDLNYDRIRDDILTPRGLSELQVQAAWVKLANPGPTVSLPAANADAYNLLTSLGNVSRALKVRYPNLQQVYFSNRIYAGYATTTLNPEPYAYESGFAVKWLVEAQIRQMDGLGVDSRTGDLNYQTVAPWLAWGPDLWANGTTPRSDGLIWERTDLAADGTHPSTAGQTKVGTLLLNFFKSSPHSQCWFLAGGSCSSPPANVFLPIVLK